MVEATKDPIEEYYRSKAKRDQDILELDKGISIHGLNRDSQIERLMLSPELDKILEQIEKEKEEAKVRKRSFKDEIESHDSKIKALVRGRKGAAKKANYFGYKYADPMNIRPVWLENKRKPYTVIYKTYPDLKKQGFQDNLPTKSQLRYFLSDTQRKAIVIAKMNSENKLQGYFVLRKTGKTPQLGKNQAGFRIFKDYEQDSRVIRATKDYSPNKFADYSDKNMQPNTDALKKICSYFSLKYRFVPVEERSATSNLPLGDLEQTIETTAAITFLTLSIILSSGILTGSSINLIAKPFSQISSIVFFIIGLLISLFMFKRR